MNSLNFVRQNVYGAHRRLLSCSLHFAIGAMSTGFLLSCLQVGCIHFFIYSRKNHKFQKKRKHIIYSTEHKQTTNNNFRFANDLPDIWIIEHYVFVYCIAFFITTQLVFISMHVCSIIFTVFIINNLLIPRMTM